MSTPIQLQDNAVHRALFALPPIKESKVTTVIVPALPAQKTVTGDTEIDALLWLREVISTGQADLIARAKEAASKIKTPLKELEKRYRDYVVSTHPGNLFAALSSFGFADLDSLSERSIKTAMQKHEAHARFGDGDLIFHDTPAEQFCTKALKGLRIPKGKFFFDAEKVDAKFDALTEQRPSTLTDCLREIMYWRDLYALRSAVGPWGDPSDQASAREDYVFRSLARIPPRGADETKAVLEYLLKYDCMTYEHTPAILYNLIGAPMPYKANRKGNNE
jgi:hypothetical protein